MLLIYPPIAKSCEPPAGLPRLAGYLRAHNIKCTMIDCNLEGLLHLFEKATPSMDTWSKRACRNIKGNLDGIRNLELYKNRDRYKRAVSDINKVLDMAGEPYGLLLSLVNYQDPEISPLNSKLLLQAFEHPEKNIFFDYFSQRFSEILEDKSPEMVGFSINYLSQAPSAFAMMGFLNKRYPDLQIVTGGGLITSWMANPGWTNPFSGIIDFMISGPGEEKLLSLLNKKLIVKTIPPDFNTLPLTDYLSPGFILPFAASSGCYWNKCNFCPEKAEGNKYTAMPSEQVLEQVSSIRDELKPSLLHFLDNAISPSLMQAIILNPPRIKWYGFARIHKELADEEFCRNLHRSGCVMLKLGLESGDQKVLDQMEKGIDLEMVSQVLKALKKAGISTYVYLLFGTPYETIVEARRTHEFVIKHRDEIGFLNIAIFNMPINSPEAGLFKVESFYEGDLCLYTDFIHPRGWNRKDVRKYLDQEFKRHPVVAHIIQNDPPLFTSNHAPFFANI